MNEFVDIMKKAIEDKPGKAIVIRHGDEAVTGYRPHLYPLDGEKVVIQLRSGHGS